MIKKKKKIKDLLFEYHIKPKRKLGQNFIFDENILNKITNSIEPIKNFCIIEIGAGPGGLTRSILEKSPKSIIVIEKDTSFKKILLELTDSFPKIKTTLVLDDFMKINVNKLEHFQENKVKLLSNLPYYISTQILLKVLPFHPNVSEASFMFQKEVAERLIASPHTKKYSKLSVLTQYCCDIKKIFNLKSNIFYPKPDVASCLLNFKPKKNLSIEIFNELKKITKFAFEKRRKTIKNALSNIEGIHELLKKLEIDEQCRAENLSVEKYVNLAQKLINKN